MSRNIICRNFWAGRCEYKNCVFLHSIADYTPVRDNISFKLLNDKIYEHSGYTLCASFFIDCSCQMGNSCPNIHTTVRELEIRTSNIKKTEVLESEIREITKNADSITSCINRYAYESLEKILDFTEKEVKHFKKDVENKIEECRNAAQSLSGLRNLRDVQRFRIKVSRRRLGAGQSLKRF